MNPFTAPASGADFEKELFPAGAQVAVLYSMVHLGNQEQGGQFPGVKDVMRFTFESPTEKRVFKEGEGEKPMVISAKYTRSMNEKAGLRKMVEGILGRTFTNDKEASSFDFRQLLGKACMIQVVHEPTRDGSKTYANIKSFMSLPKGFPSPLPFNELISYSPLMHDEETFQKLPEWMREEIKKSPEFLAMMDGVMSSANPNRELPEAPSFEEDKAASKKGRAASAPKVDDLPPDFFVDNENTL